MEGKVELVSVQEIRRAYRKDLEEAGYESAEDGVTSVRSVKKEMAEEKVHPLSVVYNPKTRLLGLRTQMILVVGATLAMILSINLALLLGAGQPVGDSARLAAQVVSGVGFLGAGITFCYGINIRGMNTATSLWTVAIVKISAG